jgi:hypothetical protein
MAGQASTGARLTPAARMQVVGELKVGAYKQLLVEAVPDEGVYFEKPRTGANAFRVRGAFIGSLARACTRVRPPPMRCVADSPSGACVCAR